MLLGEAVDIGMLIPNLYSKRVAIAVLIYWSTFSFFHDNLEMAFIPSLTLAAYQMMGRSQPARRDRSRLQAVLHLHYANNTSTNRMDEP